MIWEYLDILKSEEIIPQDITEETEKTATTGGLQQGVNKSCKVTLSDGQEYILKIGSEEHVSKWRLVPVYEQYKREVAAYLIDKILGWNIVPETKLVKVKGQEGSAQKWIKSAVHVRNVIDDFVAKLNEDSSWKIGLFDFIIGNDDRHSGNSMWDAENNKIIAIDNGYAFPYVSSSKNPRSIILSRFALKIKNKDIPQKYLEDIKRLYLKMIEENEVMDILDEPSFLEFVNRLEELLSRKKAFLENYHIIPKLLKVPPKINLEQIDVYSWVDDVLNKAQFKIEGKLPAGTKTIGYQLVYDIFNSLQEAVGSYMKNLSPGVNQNIIVEGLIQELEKWQDGINKGIQVPIEELFKRGLAAGFIDSKVTKNYTLVDKILLEFITKHPEGILPTLKTFNEELKTKFKEIITSHFADPKKSLSIWTLTDDLGEGIKAEKWQLMRIARTEVSKIAGAGRVIGWSKDPYKYFYQYFWNNASDNRTKKISIERGQMNPLTFDEASFLWQHQEQLLDDGKWHGDQYNQRCTLSRYPIDEEFKGNRFLGREEQFRKTLALELE